MVGSSAADDCGAGMSSLCEWEVRILGWYIGKYTYQMESGLKSSSAFAFFLWVDPRMMKIMLGYMLAAQVLSVIIIAGILGPPFHIYQIKFRSGMSTLHILLLEEHAATKPCVDIVDLTSICLYLFKVLILRLLYYT